MVVNGEKNKIHTFTCHRNAYTPGHMNPQSAVPLLKHILSPDIYSSEWRCDIKPACVDGATGPIGGHIVKKSSDSLNPSVLTFVSNIIFSLPLPDSTSS